MSKFWIIAKDVYFKNIKSFSFLTMIIAPFLLIGVIYLAGSLASGFSEDSQIGIVTEDKQLAQQLEQSKNDSFSFKAIKSEKVAQKQLEDEKIEGYMVVKSDSGQLNAELFSEHALGTTEEMTIAQLLNQLQSYQNATQMQLSPEQVAALNQPAVFNKTKVSFDQNGKMESGEDNSGIQMLLSSAISILLFVIITSYSSIIAQEIASEKGTRIMEVILSSTKAQTHFYGKLVGVIAVAITQFVIYGLTFVIGYSQLKNLTIVKDFMNGLSLQDVFGPMLIFTLLFFILGILVYAVLAALCGSLVSKAEDTAKAVQPILYVGLIGYFIGITIGASDPQNIVVKVTSFVPLISSYIMPVRLATETASNMEAAISLAITAVFGIALTLFSAKLYKSNVLVYNEGGVWKSLKQSISILRNEGVKS
jgi:ABC-2 type transport system permease protein